ncbi:MAG: prepilin-type N-terminal cleavage/methylation domain-containing protein [Pseudomonadota bacterium]
MDRKQREAGGFTLIELMVVVAIIGIILAVAVPFYASYKKGTCDTLAEADVRSLAAAMEKFYKDLYDQECIGKLSLDTNHLSYIVGNYYGFRGSNTKCQVHINFDGPDGDVIGWAANGSEPQGQGTRYIYRIRRLDGARQPTLADTPSGGTLVGQHYDTCYTEAITERVDSTGAAAVCQWRTPTSVPCGLLQ